MLKHTPEQVKFDMISLMNEQAIPGGEYSSHDMGMTFELANEGEVYMICQGSGGGYGDVLERDPCKLVMKDVREDLLSHELAEEIYFVVYDRDTLIVDEAATQARRDAERQARIARSTRRTTISSRNGPSRDRRTTCRITAAGTTPACCWPGLAPIAPRCRRTKSCR